MQYGLLCMGFVLETEIGLGNRFRRGEKLKNVLFPFFTFAKVLKTGSLFLSTSPLKIGLQILLFSFQFLSLVNKSKPENINHQDSLGRYLDFCRTSLFKNKRISKMNALHNSAYL